MEQQRLNRIPRRTGATPPRRKAMVLVPAFIAIGAVLVMVACGGAGDDKQEPQPTPGVDCKSKPEACK